jgi:hypothetical protein
MNYTYRPAVAYEYEAPGHKYKYVLIAFGLKSRGSREEAEAVLESYPKGARVRVYYDPDDPQSSVLQMAGGWALRAIGSALFAAMIVFLLALFQAINAMSDCGTSRQFGPMP